MPERKIIKFIHKIFVILSQTQKTIELLHLENALPVIGKSVFCFGGGAGCRDTWCLALPFTAVYFTIESVSMFVGELILRTQYLNNHGKYRHKTKQVYAGEQTLQSWSMIWVVSCMFTD